MALAATDPDSPDIAQFRFSDEDWDDLHALTGKQRAFVLEYPKDLNGTRAAERAGYAGNLETLQVMGSRLLRHPVINKLIRRLTAATADELGITREYILTRLYSIAENAALEGNHAAANSTLRTLAQLRGDMIERVEHDHRVVQVVINDVSVEDLR